MPGVESGLSYPARFSSISTRRDSPLVFYQSYQSYHGARRTATGERGDDGDATLPPSLPAGYLRAAKVRHRATPGSAPFFLLPSPDVLGDQLKRVEQPKDPKTWPV